MILINFSIVYYEMSLFKSISVILKDQTIEVPIILILGIPKLRIMLDPNYIHEDERCYCGNPYCGAKEDTSKIINYDFYDDIKISEIKLKNFTTETFQNIIKCLLGLPMKKESLRKMVEKLQDVYDLFQYLDFEYHEELKFRYFLDTVPYFNDFMNDALSKEKETFLDLNKRNVPKDSKEYTEARRPKTLNDRISEFSQYLYDNDLFDNDDSN